MAGGEAEFVRRGSGRDGDLSPGNAAVHDYGCGRFVFAVREGGQGFGECEGAGVGDDHARVSTAVARGARGSILDGDGEGVQSGRAVRDTVWIWVDGKSRRWRWRQGGKQKAPGLIPGPSVVRECFDL